MKPSELLLKKGWTQRTCARDKMGRPVPADDPNASCYCLLGAITASSLFPAEKHSIYCNIWAHLQQSPDAWNDRLDRKAKHVIRELRRAESEELGDT